MDTKFHPLQRRPHLPLVLRLTNLILILVWCNKPILLTTWHLLLQIIWWTFDRTTSPVYLTYGDVAIQSAVLLSSPFDCVIPATVPVLVRNIHVPDIPPLLL